MKPEELASFGQELRARIASAEKRGLEAWGYERTADGALTLWTRPKAKRGRAAPSIGLRDSALRLDPSPASSRRGAQALLL